MPIPSTKVMTLMKSQKITGVLPVSITTDDKIVGNKTTTILHIMKYSAEIKILAFVFVLIKLVIIAEIQGLNKSGGVLFNFAYQKYSIDEEIHFILFYAANNCSSNRNGTRP